MATCAALFQAVPALNLKKTALERKSLASSQSSVAGFKLSVRPICSSQKVFAHNKTVQSKYLGSAASGNSASSGAGVSSGNGSEVAASTVNAGTGSLVFAIGIPLIAGAIVSAFNKPTSDWYRNLRKPSWHPPDQIFGAAWSILYAVMGYASWLVWKQGGWDAQQGPLTVYAVQLVLNLLWPVFCFGFRNLFLALVDIVALLIGVYSTIQAFKVVDPFAANLLWPYFAWVAFATALNYNLWRTNRGTSPPGTYASGSSSYAS